MDEMLTEMVKMWKENAYKLPSRQKLESGSGPVYFFYSAE